MILRSGFLYREFPEIDFDESSRMWRSNKIYKGYGEFIYKSDV
jgi:hypothetical protein